MDFRLSDEQRALRDAVASFCKGQVAVEVVASRAGKAVDPQTWSELAGIGVLGLLVSDGLDGNGLDGNGLDGNGLDGDRLSGGPAGGAVEVAIAFEELGRHLCTGPVLWSTIAAPLVPGADAGRVRVAGVCVAAGGPPAGGVVVEHLTESDVLLLLYPDRVERWETAALPAGRAGEPLDPLTPASVLDALPAGVVIGGVEEAARLRLLGTALSAALLTGVARGALDTATGYAARRRQFGVPIGSFQAVKHILADMYVRVELARSAAYAAAALIDDPHGGDPARAGSAAKLLAGEAAVGNGRAAVQVLGGMGFTWEMLPHYFLKRAWVLEMGFGQSDAHALALADTLASDAAGGTGGTDRTFDTGAADRLAAAVNG